MKIITREFRGCPPTFSGRHNRVKATCWLVMLDRSIAGKTPLTIRGLSWETGIKLSSLKVLVGRWCQPSWNYCAYTTDKRPKRIRIASRGREWVSRWYNIIPVDEIDNNIEQWRKIRSNVRNNSLTNI
jgi:hypothetical protein